MYNFEELSTLKYALSFNLSVNQHASGFVLLVNQQALGAVLLVNQHSLCAILLVNQHTLGVILVDNERKSEQAHIPHAPTLLEMAVYNEWQFPALGTGNRTKKGI